MEEERKQSQRTTIDSIDRKNHSRRAATGRIEILKDRKCPYCNHNKFIMNITRFCKCSRCKKQVRI